jgi:hypothetical protein
MGTRSTIALMDDQGGIEQIYCHWDGYLDYNGRILHQHYQDPAKIRQLIELGNLSSLAGEIGCQHTRGEPNARHWCCAYGRDQGESPESVKAQRYENRRDYDRHGNSQEYDYLYQQGCWWVRSSTQRYGWMPLDEALEIWAAAAAE